MYHFIDLFTDYVSDHKVLRPFPLVPICLPLQLTTRQWPPKTLRQRHQILVLPPIFRLHHPLSMVLPNNLWERSRHHPLFTFWHCHLQWLNTCHPLPLLLKHLLRNSWLQSPSLCHPLVFLQQNLWQGSIFNMPGLVTCSTFCHQGTYCCKMSKWHPGQAVLCPHQGTITQSIHCKNQLHCPCQHLIGIKASDTWGISHTSLIVSPHTPDYAAHPWNFTSASSPLNQTHWNPFSRENHYWSMSSCPSIEDQICVCGKGQKYVFTWNLLIMITGAKGGQADTVGDSPGPAWKQSKQKIISPEIAPSVWDSEDDLNTMEKNVSKKDIKVLFFSCS